MRKLPPYFGVIMMVTCALLLPSCSAGTDSPRGVPAASDVNPVNRAELREGGILTWPVYVIQENLNFLHVDGAGADTGRIMKSMMPVIMKSDAQGNARPDPDYLEAAEVSMANGHQRVTYRINPEARWSDGSPITYRDFQANWKAQNGKSEGYRPARRTGYDLLSRVSRGATGRDVIVDFASPFGEWRSLFTPLYPSSVIGTPDGFDDGYKGKVPVTGGPFKFAGLDRATKTLTVVRDEQWWGRPALLDKIVFRALDVAAQPGAFGNGEIDFFPIGTEEPAYRLVQRNPDAQIRRAGATGYRHITMNGASDVLRDARVRRALARAIDRRKILEADLRGIGWSGNLLGNHFLLPQQKGYQDNSGEVGKCDPQAARKELDAAGWFLRGEYRTKRGVRLEIDFLASSDALQGRNRGRIIQAMLKEVGVRVNLRFVPVNQLFEKFIIPGNFDMTVFEWSGIDFPATWSRDRYMQPEEGGIQLNFSRTGTDQIDAALNAAVAETEETRAVEKLNQADRLLWQHAAVIPLFQMPDLVASRGTLANLGAQGFSSIVYQDIGFTR
ncbi:ABC transporter family substrate-binding protein [Streptomyces curacoi]|uniref:ABC transporter family substrate-binding protein n=1 Tax=Streptomyces curacoi TaxID=146536 RepID=UPI00099EF589|nr:ABC transporter family substrate-binding protein [Streptomyces curacoi]